MKKLKLLSLLSVLMISSLTGCNNNSNSDSAINRENLEFDETKPVSIKFYHTMNGTLMEVLKAAIDDFNKIYPNIHVDSVSAGGYDDVRDQMNTALSATGALCDMVYCYPDHVALYNQAKSVVVLDSYIKHEKYGLSEEQISDFIPSYYEEGKSFGDGLMYSLPFSKSSEVMYYDVTFFNKHQLNVPTHWFSTDASDTSSMEYVCEKILEIDPTSYPLGYDSESNWFITLCEQLNSSYTSSGENHYLFDNETNRNFVKKLKEMYDKHYFTTKAIYGQYTSNLFKNSNSKEARCYMCVGSSAGASNQIPDGFRFEVGVSKIPQVSLSNGKVISQGPNVCIFKNNNDPQKEIASWLLLKYLTTDKNFQANFSMISGYSPVIQSVYQEQVYQEFLDSANGYDNVMALSTKVAREQENWYFTSPAFVGSSDARDQVGNLLVKVFSSNLSVDQAINNAFKDALEELKKK